MVTFTISWLLIFSYSRVSFGFRNPKDSEEWLLLENHFQVNSRAQPWHWGNTTLTSYFDCQSPSKNMPSQRPGHDRETICTVQNLCVDSERGRKLSHLVQYLAVDSEITDNGVSDLICF